MTLNLIIFSVQFFRIWTSAWQNQKNGMWAQWRLRSDWADAQSDQSAMCSIGSWGLAFFMQTAKTDQTRLIWVFAGHTCHFDFVMQLLIYIPCTKTANNQDLDQAAQARAGHACCSNMEWCLFFLYASNTKYWQQKSCFDINNLAWLVKNSTDNTLKYFSYFSHKTGLDISCKFGDNLHEKWNPIYWEKQQKYQFVICLIAHSMLCVNTKVKFRRKMKISKVL